MEKNYLHSTEQHKNKERGGITFIEGIFQPTHLVLILIVVLIIFGPGKLPEVGKTMGRAISEFKLASTVAIKEKENEPNHLESRINEVDTAK